jgi:uncharacterized tellurite resistance protein B-like protein
MSGESFTELSAEVRVAWFGAMFAMAAADGDSARDEIMTILDRLDSEGLSADQWRTVRRYIADAPDLMASLKVVIGEGPNVRFGVYIHLIDVAWADGTMDPAERDRLAVAAKALGIPAVQAVAIESAIGRIRADFDGEITSDGALAAFIAAGVPEDVILE